MVDEIRCGLVGVILYRSFSCFGFAKVIYSFFVINVIVRGIVLGEVVSGFLRLGICFWEVLRIF